MTRQKDGVGAFEATFLNNILFRTYQRADGKSIMLAVSYGADQKQSFSIHVPEGCYRASGFDVTSFGVFNTDLQGLKIKKVLVRRDNRTEPLQYWIVMDGKVVTNHFERKLRQVYYSVFGVRAEGVLVRVSSLSGDRDFDKEYEIQKSFITDLYRSLSPALRKLLFGDDTRDAV